MKEEYFYMYDGIGFKKDNDKFWMVVGDRNRPKVCYDSYESAKREAIRLAELNSGVKFYVLEAKAEVHKDNVIVKNP